MGILIGLVGFAGSGKDSAGDAMVKNHGFIKASNADALKDVVATIFGWPREMLEGNTKESRFFREQADRFWSEKFGIKNFTPRLALQLVGTDALRNGIHHDIWVASVERKWIDLGKPNMVITDVRMPNEINIIRKNGGHLYRIRRGAEPGWYQQILFYNKGFCDDEDKSLIDQMRSTGSLPHETETAWIGSDFDQLFENDGTLADLEQKVCGVVGSLPGVETQESLGV